MKTVDKVEHNHTDLLLQLPEGPPASREFTVCREESVVAKFEERKCQLGEETQSTPRGPSDVIPKQTVTSLAKLKAWGFDMQVSALPKAAVIGSVMEYTQVVRLKTGGVWYAT